VIAGGHLLDAASGSVDWQLATPLKVTSLRFSPDGALAAFFKGFDGVSLVTVPDGKELWHGLKGDLGGALAFTDDGSHLAAADQAGNVVVVQIGERRVLWQSRIDRMFTGLAFSPGRRPDTAGHLAAANITYTRVFDYFRWRGGRMNEPSERLRMPPLTRLTFSPDGWLLGGVRYNDPWNEAVLVDTRGGELFRVHHDYAIDGLAFSPDGAFFATGDRQGRVIVVHAGSPWELWRFQADAPLTSIVFGPGGRVFLADAESARVMDAASRQADWSSPELKGVTAAAFSPDGKELTISHDRQLIRVDLARGAIVWRRRMDVDAVAFLPAGILVQRENSDEDTEQVLLSAATGEDLGLAQWHGRLLGADASGRTLFAATAERVLLRSRSQDASLWYQTAKMWGIRQVAFSGDGTVLAVARKRDGRRPGGLQVIDAGKDTTGGMRWERDSGDGFNAVAVDATGARVATGGLDGLVKVFSAADGTELVRIPHVDPVIEGLAFSRDGRAIYTCTRRGCEAHPLESQALVDQACARLPRNLTTAEWNGYLVGSPYRETCPGLPRAR
jgi:WD40 repeat protein